MSRQAHTRVLVKKSIACGVALGNTVENGLFLLKGSELREFGAQPASDFFKAQSR